MQAAGPDQCEVGEQCAHLGLLLDTADEISDRRIVFDHDGRVALRAVTDKEIDPEAAAKLAPYRRLEIV